MVGKLTNLTKLKSFFLSCHKFMFTNLSHSNNDLRNRSFFYLLISLTGAGFLWLIWNYLETVFISILIAVLFHPLYLKILAWVKGRVLLATVLTIIAIFLMVLVPVVVVILFTAAQMVTIISDIAHFFKSSDLSLSEIVQLANSLLANLPPELTITPITEQSIRSSINSLIQPASQFLINQLSNILGLGINFIALIVNTLIFIYVLGTLLPNYERIGQILKILSPFDSATDDLYFKRIIAMIESMAKGIFIIAIIQGLLSGVFYWIAGLPYVLFWIVIATFLSIIPVGSGFVTLPLGVYSILVGNVWQGVMLILAYVFFISIIDNILRPKLVSKDAQLPESLILLSVLGGISTMGFFGIIYGPVILTIFYTTVELYLQYSQKQGRIINS